MSRVSLEMVSFPPEITLPRLSGKAGGQARQVAGGEKDLAVLRERKFSGHFQNQGEVVRIRQGIDRLLRVRDGRADDLLLCGEDRAPARKVGGGFGGSNVVLHRRFGLLVDIAALDLRFRFGILNDLGRFGLACAMTSSAFCWASS